MSRSLIFNKLIALLALAFAPSNNTLIIPKNYACKNTVRWLIFKSKAKALEELNKL